MEMTCVKALFGAQGRFLDLYLLILRFGLGFVFLYAGSFKVANPTVAGMFQKNRLG